MTHGDLMKEHRVMERLADIDSPQIQRLLADAEDADRQSRFAALPFATQMALMTGDYRSCLDKPEEEPSDDFDEAWDAGADVDPGAAGSD